MGGFDIAVLLVVGVSAAVGFMRGFVQEVLSLAALAVSVIAIRYFHTDLTGGLTDMVGSESGAAVLAFGLLLLIPYFAVKLLARQAGKTSRGSVLGPVDRVLGFGFGAVKGVLIVVIVFSLLVLFYDTIWGPSGRPEWITSARTYAFVNASSDAMVSMISERHEQMELEAAAAASE
ncbi:CvpA family protein [Altererythrobacter xixiisoli]|uniref:CvpA family protein n=1 Tax=Croceibacterium xixiisoli TaxID=1476466 RepID=A0A6I4U054_9SPHN|nr:CvpA family protein [Croceibacterium xixiisoli]MXP00014.1 CvpA family protein [Croceibacterium xixiisoli]